MNRLPIITLDGPAGVGKSTLAKRVAKILKIPYLDTGAMFRTVAMRLGPGAEKLTSPDLLARCMDFRFRLEGTGEDTVLLCNDIPIGREIRTEYVGQLASRLATVNTVREYLKGAQRKLGEATALVVEGRDMGTVIFPKARFKFFLDASPDVRALRRFKELEDRGEKADLAQITEMILRRDHLDRNRPVAPLCPAEDAVIVDTSNLDIDGVLRIILEVVSYPQEAIDAAMREPQSSRLQLADAPQKEVVSRECTADATTIHDDNFSHLKADGSLTMVDVGEKAVSSRVAMARAVVELNRESLRMLQARAFPKGDVLVTAQVAGIMAAKRTFELIPLCHPVPLTFVDVRFKVEECPPRIIIESEARTSDRTGVEMEALVAAQMAAATLYDMCKAIQRDIVIRDVRLVYKSGGRSGTFDLRNVAELS